MDVNHLLSTMDVKSFTLNIQSNKTIEGPNLSC